MSFTNEQLTALKAPLDSKHVASREQGGRNLSYVEGWHVIAEANRIFGFDSWDRTLINLKQVADWKDDKGRARVSYLATVRVTVMGGHGGSPIVRDGTGTGHGIDKDPGLAHESAAKEAETDAMKRALMTFGNPFGLALYDKTQANVGDTTMIGRLQELEEAMIASEDTETLDGLVTAEYAGDLEQLFQSDKGEWQRLSALYRRKREELAPKKEIELKPEPKEDKKK